MKNLLGIITNIILLLCVTASSEAIVFGEPDGEDHPYVGLAVFDDAEGNPMWRCSGALLSPTIFITAGHCEEAPAVRATLGFESDVDAGIPFNGYPFGGPTSVDGTLHIHPDYDPLVYPDTNDLGVVILDTPVSLGEYGLLPTLDEVISLSRPTIFTIVGYGFQEVLPNPNTTQAERVRYTGSARLLEFKSKLSGDTHVHLSSNPGKAARGGYCFGDSGGPAFIEGTDVIVGIGSFLLNNKCMGAGFYNRLDTGEALDWLTGFLP